MNHIDYQLGLSKPKKMEDWTYADGMGMAKFKLNNCRRGCSLKHPFNKRKRESCESVCEAAYRESIKQIGIRASEVENAVAQQTGSQVPHGAPIPILKPTPSETNENVDDRGSNSQNESSKGLSTGAKVAIGVGALALIVGVVVYIKRKNK